MTILQQHIPAKALPIINKWIAELNISIKLSKKRNTKLGDFQALKNGKTRISINQNLNPYAFLITLTHELAHAFVWQQHQRDVLPHGKEWKKMFLEMMFNFLTPEIFPEDILRAISKHLLHPKASTSSDIALTTILRKYDAEKKITIAEISDGSTFQINNGRKFVKEKKVRTRYRCKELNSNKIYLFSPLVEISLS